MRIEHDHACEDPEIYAMADVTVWIRIKADGGIGAMRESRKTISDEARSLVNASSDLVCATCGWTGRASNF